MAGTPLTVIVDQIISRLSEPLPEEEIKNGWSETSQKAMLSFFRDLRIKLSQGEVLPYLGILRGLDHWGVEGGEIFHLVAQLDHQLRAHEIRD